METRSSKPWDLFIVGGGPAGLATAVAARSHGLSVVVADGAVPPIDKPCGEGLMPDGVEALHQLGITIPEGEAYPFRGIRFVSDGIQAEAAFPRGTARGIRRTHLHRVMVDHAAACGVRLLWQAAVTGLHPEGALVAGELVRARWVVGADGTSSRVRDWAKLDGHELDAPLDGNQEKNLRFAFRRHYRVKPWTDFMELHWGRRCQIYATPVGARRSLCGHDFAQPEAAARRCAWGISRTLRAPRRCGTHFERTGRHHCHAKVAARVSWPDRVGGRRLWRSRRHYRRRSLPRLSASRAARRVPGERGPGALSKRSSPADPPSRPDGSHDAVHGQTSSSTAAHYAGIPVESSFFCWHVGHARGRRLHAGSHGERNRFRVETAESLTLC